MLEAGRWLSGRCEVQAWGGRLGGRCGFNVWEAEGAHMTGLACLGLVHAGGQVKA